MDVWELTKRGYLRLVSPFAGWLVARRVNPNHITTIGTGWAVVAGVLFASGRIVLAGWVLGLTAVFDVIDGEVARRSGRTTVFGAFYDSTLDRISDGALLGGLTLFFARTGVHHLIPPYMATPMVVVMLLCIVGSFLTSYTRARAEGLGIDAKVGILQRPERIVLLCVPQGLFGVALNGWVLIAICGLLTVTAWITVVQRITRVWRATLGEVARTETALPIEREQTLDEPRGNADGPTPMEASTRRPSDVASEAQWDAAR